MSDDALRKQIHDLRNELCKAQLRVDLLRMVLNKCPFVHIGDGVVRTARATNDADIVEWLNELFEARKLL